MTTSLPWPRSLCAIGRSPEEPHGHSLALWSSPHPAPRQGSPGSPAALVSSGSGPPGSTCTRSWVRRRTQEPKVALRSVARWGSSTLSRYLLSSQARGLTPSASARPSTLRARSLCLGHGRGGSRRAQGTWAGDALHQGVHQGLPERPAQCLGCLVVRKEAVGKALLVLQRPVQSATASRQHRVPGAAELPWESRAQGCLPALPLPRHDGSLALLAPSSQQGPNLQCLWPGDPALPGQPLPCQDVLALVRDQHPSLGGQPSLSPGTPRWHIQLLLSQTCSSLTGCQPCPPGTPGMQWHSQETTHLPKSCSSHPRSRQISWLQA